MAQGFWRDQPAVTRQSRVLFRLIGANMNSTADQTITKMLAFNEYIFDRIVVTNASVSLTTAVGGVYSAAAKGGTAIVAAAQAYAALTTAAGVLSLTLASTNKRTETPILSLTTPQGATATADIYVIGVPLT